MKTLVLGLGNPILGDDSVGLCVARSVGEQANGLDITAVESTGSGLALLDEMIGFDRVVIVDAITTKNGRAGDIYRLSIKDIDTTRHSGSPHDTNLTAALELGRRLGLAVPKDIVVVAVETSPDCFTFSEECSPVIQKAIPSAVDMVMKEIN